MIKRLLILGALTLGLCAQTSIRVVDGNGSGTAQLFNNSNANITTAVQVNGTSTVVKAIKVLNTTAAACYIQFFNATSANVTLGTTAPTTTLGFGANASETVAIPTTAEMRFTTALTVAATTTQTGAATCAMAITIFYSVAPVQP